MIPGKAAGKGVSRKENKNRYKIHFRTPRWLRCADCHSVETLEGRPWLSTELDEDP